MLINLARLNKIKFNAAKNEATIQGGAIVSDVIQATYDNDSRIATPNCPCLGMLGASLGGGLNRMAGLYGMAVDQIKSMEVVLASGAKVTASRTSHKELYWALRGAAPNFGIVTSAVFEAYPTPREENIGWQGSVTFEDAKLERVIDALEQLPLGPRKQFDIILLTNGAPFFTPSIQVIPLYLGNEKEARKAFKPVLDIGPSVDETKETPYSELSDWAIPACAKGGRKPTYGVSSRKLDTQQIRAAYEEFKSFIAKYGSDVGFSSILFEKYPTEEAVQRDDDTSSYPLRDVSIHVAIVPWSENSALAGPTDEFASTIRSILRLNNEFRGNETHINFARGDESLRDIYGKNLKTLKSYKKHYDPENRFDQWFNIV